MKTTKLEQRGTPIQIDPQKGETIEMKIRRITQNKEPITDVAQPIYMERGVKICFKVDFIASFIYVNASPCQCSQWFVFSCTIANNFLEYYLFTIATNIKWLFYVPFSVVVVYCFLPASVVSIAHCDTV